MPKHPGVSIIFYIDPNYSTQGTGIILGTNVILSATQSMMITDWMHRTQGTLFLQSLHGTSAKGPDRHTRHTVATVAHKTHTHTHDVRCHLRWTHSKGLHGGASRVQTFDG